jgi:3',5'-cyclic AMP phosphodiesterase CpdA
VDDSRFKVLVVHHQLHPTAIGPISPHPVARYAQKTLDEAADVGVDLVLCGHLHVSAIKPLSIIPGEHRIVIASAGTATSNRYRKPTGPVNFYNVVSVEPDTFSVEERRYVSDEEQFVRDGVTRFERAD